MWLCYVAFQITANSMELFVSVMKFGFFVILLSEIQNIVFKNFGFALCALVGYVVWLVASV